MRIISHMIQSHFDTFTFDFSKLFIEINYAKLPWGFGVLGFWGFGV